MKKLSFIISGTGGFIGSKLLEHLEKEEFPHLIFKTSKIDRLEKVSANKSVIHFKNSGTFHKYAKHLGDFAGSILINPAWKGVLGKDKDKEFQIKDNLEFQSDLLNFANSIAVKHYIGFGSQAQYGPLNKKCSEKDQLNAVTQYGVAKNECENSSRIFCQQKSIRHTWIRLFDPYGPGDNPKWFIPYVCKKLINNQTPRLTKCEQLWDFLYIDDLTELIFTISKKKISGSFNVGSGNSYLLKDVVNEIVKISKKNIKPEFGANAYGPQQIMHLQADIAKVKKETGWAPRTHINDGLKSTYEYFENY